MRYACLLVLTAAALAGNEPGHWVFFESRETGNAPVLEIEFKNGASRILAADADSVLIRYLADKAWGFHKRLSIQLGDANRVLVKFEDLPAGGLVKKAELVLSMKLSESPPTDPFELAVHRVKEGWDERDTTWASQPKAEGEPDLTLKVEPKAQELRIDVTASLRKGAPHGWLVKVPGALRTMTERLDEVLPLAAHVGEALQRARFEKKTVLALVGGSPKPDFGEVSLIAVAFSHPAVREAVKKRFVPVRIHYTGNHYTLGQRVPELERLGTSVDKAKAPALVLATADGKHLRTLEAIGTYDYGIVLRFLGEDWTSKEPGVRRMRSGRLKDALESFGTSDEAKYWRGALLWRAGEQDAARRVWRSVAADSPWRWKCDARLQWPGRLDTSEPLRAPVLKKGARTTETEADPRAALAYLAATQEKDGSWTPPDRTEQYHAAVTALCARALLAHNGKKDAIDKATAWLSNYVSKKDPGDANAWSSGYALDFFLDRFERDKAFRKDAQAAADLVAGGQGPKGAWSYSRNWGARWKGGFGGWPKTERGRYHSMNTGPCLASLARAKKLGLTVDDGVLRKGVQALKWMRDAPGVFTYTWPEPRCFNKPESSIARAPACELALLMLGATEKKDLKTTMGYFLKWRHDLRKPAKVTAAWTAPRGYSGYFFHFAYFHAGEAFRHLGDKAALEQIRKDLNAVAERDGTWTDWAQGGKPYATALALLTLR